MHALHAVQPNENLVVKDDPFVREMAVASLEDAGYNTVEAASGGEALRLLQAGIAVDALLTDIRMPEANGWVVAQALSRALSRSARPVCDRLCRANAACSGWDHHFEALQDCSGCEDHGSMSGLRGIMALAIRPYLLDTVITVIRQMATQQVIGAVPNAAQTR